MSNKSPEETLLELQQKEAQIKRDREIVQNLINAQKAFKEFQERNNGKNGMNGMQQTIPITSNETIIRVIQRGRPGNMAKIIIDKAERLIIAANKFVRYADIKAIVPDLVAENVGKSTSVMDKLVRDTLGRDSKSVKPRLVRLPDTNSPLQTTGRSNYIYGIRAFIDTNGGIKHGYEPD